MDGSAPLYAAIIALFALVMKLHQAQLDECRKGRKECDEDGKAKQRQIDALIDGDPEAARAYRRTSDQIAVVEQPKKKRRRWLPPLSTLALLLALALLLCGCDDREQERRQQTANSAATIYEAALAIQQGAPAALPLQAIEHNASSIAAAQGYQYPPPAPVQLPGASPVSASTPSKENP